MFQETKFSSYYKGKNILVTGGTGYIGCSVVSQLSRLPCNIIVLSKNSAKKYFLKNCKAKISMCNADIRNKKIWTKLLTDKLDIIFHFAAQTSARYANDNPSSDLAVNLLPVVNMIEACQYLKVFPDIVFSGTATEVGLTSKYPVNETHMDKPTTVYDINKLSAEKYLQYYSQETKGRAVTLRLANVYGPGMQSSSADRGILNAMICRALEGQSITIYGEGKFVRDYIYIDDVREAFLAAGASMDTLKGKYYFIGSGRVCTIEKAFLKIKCIVKKKTGIICSLAYIPTPVNSPMIELRNFVANTAGFRAGTSWRPHVRLEEGIEKTIDYFNKERIQR